MSQNDLLLSLCPTASFVEDADGPRIMLPGKRLLLRRYPEPLLACIRDLQRRGATESLLGERVVHELGNQGLCLWSHCVLQLARAGALAWTVYDGDRAMARLAANRRGFDPDFTIPAKRFVLSRFAYLRRVDSGFHLESPLSAARIEILDPAVAAFIAALAEPATEATVSNVCERLVQRETSRALLALFHMAHMLTPIGDDGSDEDRLPFLAPWSFSDLLFHASARTAPAEVRSRSYPFADAFPPLPVVKPPMSTTVIQLPVPVEPTQMDDAPTFDYVLESRRSIRGYANTPIHMDQLGEFLYRAARVINVIEPDGKNLLQHVSRRPYPGGGAVYELDLYPVVHRCNGLSRGVYHYDPLHHRLELLPGRESYVDRILRNTFVSTDQFGERQVLIILSARFARMMWKYPAMAYAVILQDVGVLLQTMYLVATRLGLAPCAVGAANADLFTEIVGCAFYEETSVGEFMLGSMGHADVTARGPL